MIFPTSPWNCFYFTVLPKVISSAVETGYKGFSKEINGIALTSKGDLAVVDYRGVKVDVYSPELAYLYPLNITAPTRLVDATSKDDRVFVSDEYGNRVHVVYDNGTYSHYFGVCCCRGIAIYGYMLYAAVYNYDIIAIVYMDQSYRQIRTWEMSFNPPPDGPQNVFGTPDTIAVASYVDRDLKVYKMDGSLEWTYLVSVNGADNPALGVVRDEWGRYYQVDYSHFRVLLILGDGSNGTVLATTANRPLGVLLDGKVLYVTTRSGLHKFTLN